jgi:hypothetical protein
MGVWIGADARVVGPIMVLLLVVLPVVGLLVTIGDEFPDGFDTPEGKTRRPGSWRRWENWADLAIRASLCGIGFAIDAGWRTSAAIVPWIFGAVSVVALLAFGGRIYRSDLSRSETQAGRQAG